LIRHELEYKTTFSRQGVCHLHLNLKKFKTCNSEARSTLVLAYNHRNKVVQLNPVLGQQFFGSVTMTLSLTFTRPLRACLKSHFCWEKGGPSKKPLLFWLCKHKQAIYLCLFCRDITLYSFCSAYERNIE